MLKYTRLNLDNTDTALRGIANNEIPGRASTADRRSAAAHGPLGPCGGTPTMPWCHGAIYCWQPCFTNLNGHQPLRWAWLLSLTRNSYDLLSWSADRLNTSNPRLIQPRPLALLPPCSSLKVQLHAFVPLLPNRPSKASLWGQLLENTLVSIDTSPRVATSIAATSYIPWVYGLVTLPRKSSMCPSKVFPRSSSLNKVSSSTAQTPLDRAATAASCLECLSESRFQTLC